MPVEPNDDTASSSPTLSPNSASTGCPGPRRCKQWRDRVMFLRASEGDDSGPICPTRRWRQPQANGSRRALAGKTALGDFTRG